MLKVNQATWWDNLCCWMGFHDEFIVEYKDGSKEFYCNFCDWDPCP